MPTVIGPDGKKRHVCDDDCQRICNRCRESYSVHGMWRWGIQPTPAVSDGVGGGGLICDKCSSVLLGILHSGEDLA